MNQLQAPRQSPSNLVGRKVRWKGLNKTITGVIVESEHGNLLVRTDCGVFPLDHLLSSKTFTYETR